MTVLRETRRALTLAAVVTACCGCGSGQSDDEFRSIEPGVEVKPAAGHVHGAHGGHFVTVRRQDELQVEVSVDEDRRLAVHLPERADGEPDQIRGMTIELEHGGASTSFELVRAEDATRYDLVGELPDAVRSIEDIAGTLVVNVDGVEIRGSLTEFEDVHVHAPGDSGSASMSTTIGFLVVYGLLIMAASLFGGWLPSLIDLTHDRMQAAMSVVGGLMLGIGVFHLLPHGVNELGGVGAIDRGMWWTMIGLVSMFLLLRTFHFHQHGPVAHPVEGVHEHEGHEHDDSHGHSHGHSHSHSAHELSWLGVFIGLSVHTLIDGIALAASVEADARHGHDVPLFGLGTFLAVLLHKPLDAVSITTLMSAGGWSAGQRNLVNLAYASMCPLGALAFVLGVGQLGGMQHLVLGCALCFAAGVFLCISLGDILPEMEFHAHNRVQLTLLLLVGIGLAWGIGFLEPAHVHAH